MNDDYVYYENTWNDLYSNFKRNNDNLMWRYWAAKEMANDILMNTYEAYYNSDKKQFYSCLTQILKKEWFR